MYSLRIGCKKVWPEKALHFVIFSTNIGKKTNTPLSIILNRTSFTINLIVEIWKTAKLVRDEWVDKYLKVINLQVREKVTTGDTICLKLGKVAQCMFNKYVEHKKNSNEIFLFPINNFNNHTSIIYVSSIWLVVSLVVLSIFFKLHFDNWLVPLYVFLRVRAKVDYHVPDNL